MNRREFLKSTATSALLASIGAATALARPVEPQLVPEEFFYEFRLPDLQNDVNDFRTAIRLSDELGIEVYCDTDYQSGRYWIENPDEFGGALILCDGRRLDSMRYPKLYNIIGTRFGR